MKEDTKKLAIIGGAAVVGLIGYSMLSGEEGYAGMGGGGGMPLLPALEEGVEEKKEEVAPTVFNFPEPEAVDWGVDWDDEGQDMAGLINTYIHPDDTAPLLKKEMSVETYADIVPPGEYLEAAAVDTNRIYGGVGVSGSKKSEGKAWYAPWTWDIDNAVDNYQDWVSASNKRTLDIGKSSGSDNTSSLVKKYQAWVSASNKRTLNIGKSGGGSAKEWTYGSESLARRKEVFGNQSIYDTPAGSTRETPHSKKRKSAPGSPD